MADETAEVRSLLMRHRLSIARDLIGTSLLQVLLKAGVLTAAQEKQLHGEPSLDARCDQLIELIARDGFEKFKQFCYAIESECSQLIADLINDKLSQPDDDDDDEDDEKRKEVDDAANVTAIVTTSGAGATVEPNLEGALKASAANDILPPGVTLDDSSLKNGRDTIDSNRSRRSTSYCGTSTPTPMTVPINNAASSRRSSLISATASAASSQLQQPPPIPQLPSKVVVGATGPRLDLGVCESKFAVSNNNFNNSSMSNGSSSSNNQSNNLQGISASGSSSTNGVPDASVLSSIRQALGQGHIPPSNKRLQKSKSAAYSYFNPKRFSSPPFGEITGGTTDRRLNLKNKTASLFRSKSKKEQRMYRSMNETIEVLADQVVEDEKVVERTSWDYSTVTLSRVTGYGFGIAVSGGRDNPHFANGDPSIAVSDVLKNGPAEGQLQVNDRIISVNGVSLENVEYATAVQVLRDSGNTVTLMVKRRVPNHGLMHPLPGANMLPMAGPGVGGPAGPAGGMGPVPPGVGMNSHQHQHSLSSTGLGLNNGSQQQIKVIVTKASKKDDFGIVLGCRLFIREISSKTKDQLAANGYSLQEGDLVTRIHNTNCNDAMSLKEAKKIIDGCKERLTLAVLREPNGIGGSYGGVGGAAGTGSGMQSPVYSHTAQVSNCSNMDDSYLNGPGGSYSGQNLYVQPPTRPSAMSTLLVDDKSNLTPRGRSRGPLTDISLQQLDRPSTPPGTSSRTADGVGHSRSRSVVDEPPRPPPPRGEDFYATRRQLLDEKPPTTEPRYITFQKEGSVGIRLTGGNEVGIFVTAVQQNSPASAQGLVPGDKILKVNDMDMNGVTREEAVLFLLSLQDRIDLIVQYCKEEFDNITAQQRGDSFHIKTHFHCDTPTKGELTFKAGDVFRVIDTLYNGVVGAWQVLRIGRGHQELQRGVIPNKARAEELATVQFNASKKELNASESRVSFFRRRRSTHRRSKSLSRENWDDVVFSDAISKFPAYERVVLRHPGFVRPVVIFGPVADIARDRLMKDFADKYTAPLQDDDKGSSKCGGIVRLSNIRDIMDRGKHALLDVTPNAVDRLNYAQFYPIVIFLKADTKHTIKQMRQGLPKSAHKSSKKLFEQCQKLERVWSHVFSTTINLNDPDTWYRKLRDSIDQQQSGAVWMSETKPVESLSDDFLFPMTTSRLSYASSPESDLELSPGPSASLSLGNLPQLVKSSSDPSIATNQDNLERDRELGDGMPPPYTNPYEHAPHSRRMTVDNKYGFSSSKNNGPAPMPAEDAIYGSSSSRPAPPLQGSSNGSHFGTVPDLPPRIDRASKPANAPGAPSTSGSSLPSRNSSSGGTLGRSAQERLFGNGKQSSTDALHDPTSAHDEYSSRNQLLGLGPGDKRPALPSMVNGGTIAAGTGSSLERNPNANTSLDRSGGSRSAGHHHPASVGSNTNTPSKANGSYDSVSSYDSYNTSSQLTAQNMRLGPNAPDDLKSVPNTRNGSHPMSANQSGLSEYGRNPSLNNTASDMLLTTARSNYNGAPVHETLNQRNSGDRTGGNMNMPQRPTNLVLDSPRKHMIETKTDYGKYSRNNSASQADYSKPNKGPGMIGSPGPPPGAMGPNGANGAPFKPVPPPKPKNYRPPIGGGSGSNGSGMHHSGQWDSGEPISPRSPDGFYYPPMASSHYHQAMAHNVPSSPNNGGSHAPPMHPYNPYAVGNGAAGGNGGPMYNGNANGSHSYMSNGVRDMGAMGASNGYNNGNAQYPYGNTYMHRGNGAGTHGIGNMPALHPSDRHALDLAGSREQRGSAFELYRKPQLGTVVGHHHNIRDMEPMMSIHEFNQHQQHLIHQQRMRQLQQQPLPPIPGPAPRVGYGGGHDPSLPPELPAKPPKKNILKSPLKAIKNAFIKSTRPLRRQVSLVGDSDKKSLRPILKRQHSMMEPRSSRMSNMRRPDQQQQHYDQRQMYAQEQQAYYNDPRYGSSYQGPYSPQPVRGFQRHEPYYPKDANSTYQNLELESMYGSNGAHGRSYYDPDQPDGQGYYPQAENLYANRALIELERGRGPLGPGATVSTLGRRIVRRHSMADRTVPSPSFSQLNRRRMGSERAPHHAPITDHHRMAMGNANVSHSSAHDESIYQSKSGSYLYNEAREHTRRTFEDPVYQSRREMHRDHLYQSKKQMQDRIQQSRMVEMHPQSQQQQQQQAGSSPASGNGSSSMGGTTTSAASDRFMRNQGLAGTASGSCSSSPNSPSSSSCKSGYSSSRNGGEMRERRSQMRDQIYQSRKEAMESMAEPVYVSRRELKHEPIYESKNEHDSERVTGQQGCDPPVAAMEQLSMTTIDTPSDSVQQQDVACDTTVVEGESASVPAVAKVHNLGAPLAAEEDDDDEDEMDENERSEERTLTVSNQNDSGFEKQTSAGGNGPTATSSPVPVPPLGTPKSVRATHLSNFLKRTAPPVMPPPPPPTNRPPRPEAPVYVSRTSIETQYTSQATGSQMSLPIGPPNATSTPFASELSLGLPPPRQPITRRGLFDASGGSLADPIWNVSLHIPPGAIAPGVQQEIYFTVTDPRLSESVGGPPLDMENGETMLSPLVMCGPQGTEFLKPVTLNIPHCAGRTASLGLSLKATDSEKNLQTDWEDIDLPSNTAAHTVSVKVDHF
ncbi:tight junction protein ZO-1 [Anopheles nili]|uniref:tight junction protein ZO-1 n=1 Tax=Anopheles nili TaxID=185578 RepID=UPI00237A901E|nr:tight junction protein ZO-1 [Anopheles nili]